jgi:hypothetical protein
MPILLATQEAEIRRIEVQSLLRQIVHETLFWKNSSQKRSGGVAQGVGPEFKSQYGKKKKKWHYAFETKHRPFGGGIRYTVAWISDSFSCIQMLNSQTFPIFLNKNQLTFLKIFYTSCVITGLLDFCVSS